MEAVLQIGEVVSLPEFSCGLLPKEIFALLAILASLREKGLRGADSISTIKFSKEVGRVEGNRIEPLSGYKVYAVCRHFFAKTPGRKDANQCESRPLPVDFWGIKHINIQLNSSLENNEDLVPKIQTMLRDANRQAFFLTDFLSFFCP